MRQSNRKIWLIPALIIGFNCLAFIVILAISINRERGGGASDYTNTVSEDASGASLSGSTGSANISYDDMDEAYSASDDIEAVGLDESFYDDDADYEPDLSSGYVLLLTSSESDLRIQMVDSTGKGASDMNWVARVRKLSDEAGEVSDSDGDIDSDDENKYVDEFEAEDDDEDGIIYLDEMSPGSYDVVVDNGSGIVEASSITIKPKIRYTASAGIRSIVMQESDIDAAVEDTASTPDEKEDEAESEGEGTESPADIALPQGTLGIDVSKYNKEIDWNRVRSSGIEFAIIRAGYRGSSTGVLVEDPYFRQNLAGAKAAGMRIGVYFFTQAVNPDEAREEAEAVASLVNASDLSLPVFLDVESSGNVNGGRADLLDTVTRTEVVRTFCETAENLGYSAGVYANKTWMTNRLDMSSLAPYTKWLAQYRAEGPTYEGDYSIWQYTSSGSVDGINGRVDLDVLIK